MTEISYDVFISHAFEDKNAFANELALALKKQGLKVWYSGSELKLGDSIMESVNNALKAATYGIVIISPIYLEKQWAMSELKALFAQEADRNRILPILHNITIDEIKNDLPILADRYAISSGKGLQIIVNKVMQVVKGKRKYTVKKAKAGTAKSGTAKKKNKKTSETKNTNTGFIALGGTMNIKATNIAARDINIQNKKNK
ncbi:MAG: toll/interleukin-1 receptor domain-containing protein [Bacteroidia bacterium]